MLFTPAEFLRVAEDSDKTAELGRWMLEEAVEQAAERTATGLAVSVAVRMSARRLLDRSMPLGSIEALLTRHGLPSGSLVIELSDTDPRVSLDELERRLTALRRLGVRIALDGFGSGYAALTTLRRLPRRRTETGPRSGRGRRRVRAAAQDHQWAAADSL